MKKLLFLFSVLIFISCSEKQSAIYNEMVTDKLMSESFTNNELEGLAKIVIFFEEQVFEKYATSNDSLKEVYDKFNFADSIEYVGNHSYLNFIDFKKQKELFKKLDTVMIYKIWQHPKDLNYQLIDEELFISCSGVFLNFIEKVGKSNFKFRKFTTYAESLKSSCGISVQNTVDLTINYRFFDVTDIKTRLLFAVHYLSTNEELIQTQLKK